MDTIKAIFNFFNDFNLILNDKYLIYLSRSIFLCKIIVSHAAYFLNVFKFIDPSYENKISCIVIK